MAGIKKAKVKRTIYSKITDSLVMWKFIDNCITTGGLAALFKDPNILAAFYALGVAARGALKTAMDAYVAAPTKGNHDVVLAKMALVIIWLDGYSDQVETISNTDTNRTTYEEAVANIKISYLTPQKPTGGKKGKPDKVTFTIKELGGGDLLCEVTNGDEYQPSGTTFFAVELPAVTPTPIPSPDVSLDGDQINIVSYGPSHFASQSSSGKGNFTTLKKLNKGSRYAIYGFSQNGKKFISDLSAPIIIEI